MLRSRTQVDNDKAFLQCKSNGTQIEQGLSGALLYLPHSWKPSRISRYSWLPQIFVQGTRKRVGGDPKKFFATGKVYGLQSTKVFFRKMLYFNQLRRFPPEKVPKYSIDEVIVRVSTPTHHDHEPLGIQILARTLHWYITAYSFPFLSCFLEAR